MIVVLAIDALEYDLVEEFGCEHLKQQFYGTTDISEFSEPRTMVLWTSFMTGKNLEMWVIGHGDRDMWNISLPLSDTFFRHFKNPAIIDLPGYNYDREQHAREREMLKAFFEAGDIREKDQIREEYNRHAFEYHRAIKVKFQNALSENHDFVLGYFSVVDVLGHLNFGNRTLMRMIYKDMDEIASTVPSDMIVLSDHGMMAIGPFGDHSSYGFWSTGNLDLGMPKITELQAYILNRDEQPSSDKP